MFLYLKVWKKLPFFCTFLYTVFLYVLPGIFLLTEPGPAQAMVCNLVKGTRIAHAIGREIGEKDESDLAKKVVFHCVCIFFVNFFILINTLIFYKDDFCNNFSIRHLQLAFFHLNLPVIDYFG